MRALPIARATLLALLLSGGAAWAEAAFPGGWWTVERSSTKDLGTPGAGWKLAADESVAVHGDRAERRLIRCRPAGTSRWSCQLGEGLGMDIDASTPDRLKLSGRASEVVELRRAKPDEAKSFERATARLSPVAAACAAAKKCFEASCAATGQRECNFSKEADGTSLRECEATIRGIRVLLERLNKPIPPECVGAK